nr:MAG TPA: hypothetical protein [Caudoviricetes sp.]
MFNTGLYREIHGMMHEKTSWGNSVLLLSCPVRERYKVYHFVKF